MPVINGRYYANPAYGRALERARVADQDNDAKTSARSQQPQGGSPQTKSWEEKLLDRVAAQPPPPPRPSPPPADERALERSVDATRVNTLTVHQVGLIVFNETQSLSNSRDSNESIDAAREKIAHAVMNGDRRFGLQRPLTAGPIEPSEESLRNPAVRAAYDSSIAAAERAYLDTTDPTRGATHVNQRPNDGRGGFTPRGVHPPGLPIRTQSGPFNNSFPKGGLPRRGVYVDTYQ